MDFKGNTEEIIVQAVNAAKEELENYPDMPEHYSAMMKHPNMDAKGYYSEIDMDIAARFKKCDTYAQRKNVYEQAMYKHVRQEIETKGAELKNEVQNISKQHRVLTRAARLCKDEEAKKIILARADALKESEAVKNYNMLITGLEHYAGIGPSKMERTVVNALDSLIGYSTSGMNHMSTGQGYRERPEQIKIEFRNMDEYLEQFKLSHPEAKGKTPEELDKLSPSYELFEKNVLQYGKDALEDTLNSCFETLDERLDLIIINGQTLREMLEEKEGIKGRSPQEVNDLSCNLLTAALKSGARVEAYMLESVSGMNKSYYPESVPMRATEPKERVTMSFWEKFAAFFGFYKEKAKMFKEQETIDRKMEECKKRVVEKMSKPLTKEEISDGKIQVKFCDPMTKEQEERMQIGREIAKENCDSFVRQVRTLEQINAFDNKLNYSFFPEEGKTGVEVKIEGKEVRLGREKPFYLCVIKMLQRGIPYEEVLDPTKHQELRVQIGKELKEEVATMTKEEHENLLADGMMRMEKCVDDFAKKMSQEITSIKDVDEKFVQLYSGIRVPQIVQMDIQKTENTMKQCGGEKNFDALRDKVRRNGGVYTIGTRLSNELDKYYKVLQGKTFDMGKLMYGKMEKVSVVQALQSENPAFGVEMSEETNNMYAAFMKHHPEVKKLQEKANNMDKEVLNDILATDGEKHAHMELDVFDKEAENLTPIGGFEAKTVSMGVNVVINGEGIAKFDVPEKQVTKQEEPKMDEEMSM